MSISDNNKRIARNTIFLYIRMFVMIVVNLYTARVILQTLGIDDFGIYNVVAGIVVLFSFINNSMAIASQRFLSYALGKEDNKEVIKVFDMSINSHIGIALIVFVIAETIGLYILKQMNFPPERDTAIAITYHIAVITCLVQITRVPYNALIIAYEKMSFYAWISIIEGLLNLAIAFLLINYAGDKLIFYSFLLLATTFTVNIVYIFFCKKKLPTCVYHFFWDKKILKKYISFSGWSLSGSLANVCAQQGLNMIINIFCGVAVNAAVGISNQVTSAVGRFLSNFQTAFNPQMVKSFAIGDSDYFMNLIIKTSKFSFYLMLIISLPILINCEFFLKVWLGTLPQYAVEFSQLMIIFLLFDAISGPLWISVQATGQIRDYQLLMSFLILLNLPFCYITLFLGCSPIYVFVGRVLINIITLIVRIIYLHSLIKLPISRFRKEVINVLFVVCFFSVPIPVLINQMLETNWYNVFIVSFISIITTLSTIYIIGLTVGEKDMLKQILIKKFIKDE